MTYFVVVLHIGCIILIQGWWWSSIVGRLRSFRWGLFREVPSFHLCRRPIGVCEKREGVIWFFRAQIRRDLWCISVNRLSYFDWLNGDHAVHG